MPVGSSHVGSNRWEIVHAKDGRYEEMYQVVEEYFRRKGQKITFDETKLNFFAV